MGLKNKVPEYLSRFVDEIQIEKEVGEDTPTFLDCRVLVSTSSRQNTGLEEDSLFEEYDEIYNLKATE